MIQLSWFKKPHKWHIGTKQELIICTLLYKQVQTEKLKTKNIYMYIALLMFILLFNLFN